MINRREFNQYVLSSAAGMASGCAASEALQKTSGSDLFSRASNIPPLYCLAYINPTLDWQKGQENTIAKFPMALVPQNMLPTHVAWRERIREKNPDIIMLGYQMTIEETKVPGPGHDIMRTLDDAWVTYPGGFVPKITWKDQIKRIFDPSKEEWQKRFLEACSAVLEAYRFDGLFLDQCTVFARAALTPGADAKQKAGLQKALVALRESWPDKIFIANSRYNWEAVNGEMNEGRIEDYDKELIPFPGHARPQIDLAAIYYHKIGGRQDIRPYLKNAVSRKAFFYACETAQKVEWHAAYDELIDQWNTSSRP